MELWTPSGRRLDVEVAADPEFRRRGLSGRPGLPPDAALALAFPEPVPVAIWMRGMRFPLDAVWLDAERVVDLYERIPPPAPGTPDAELPVYTGRAPADVVLELPAGSARGLGLVPGATVGWAPARPRDACAVR